MFEYAGPASPEHIFIIEIQIQMEIPGVGWLAQAQAARKLAAAIACLTLAGVAASSDLVATLASTAAAYFHDVASIAKITGRDTTMDYYQRLIDDQELLNDPAPPDYTQAMWQHSVATITRLDLSVADQLLQNSFTPMSSVRGLEETFVRSSKDGTMQPVAVYVPSNYIPGHRTPLVVFLHGRPQPESQLMAPQFLTDLAEKSGTVVIAPYGRAYYDFVGSESDVYDALDAAFRAFTIDPRKTYLAGYSMGGFSVFDVAPIHPDRWSAVMSISGSLLGSRAHKVVATLPRTPFYVLTGARDQSIPTQYPTATAVYLRDMGLPVTFYSEPEGTHRLFTLLPILKQAWSDMLAGIVRTPAELGQGFTLPNNAPAMSVRP